jgi:hypothetical protein
MSRFREDSLRAAQRKSADRARKLSARGRRKSKPLSYDAEFFARRARDTADLIQLRLEKGYRRFGDRKLSGHYVGPKHEMGLRSETLKSMAAELFPALVPSAKKLRTSWGKSELETLGTKLFSLDEPYIEGNREFLGFIRIDTDRVWRSIEECRSFYEGLVSDGRIACAPHFLVGLRLRDGSYVRPHAIWLLPYGEAVWNAPGHPRWRPEPVELFKGVYYGLCNSLLEAGADPAAPATSQQVKNPLSPEWTTVCMQDSHFPSLTEHAEYLDMSSRRENLIRRAADVQTGLEVSQSNVLFNTLQRAAYATLRQWHFDANTEYRDAIQSSRRGRLADSLHVALSDRIREMDLSEIRIKDTALELMIAKVADYAATSWDPKKAFRSGSSRGVIRHIVEGMKTVKERRQAAAAYATSRKTEKTLDAMFAAVQRLKADGKVITKSAVARESGISRKTVITRWNDLPEGVLPSSGGCVVRWYVKKGFPLPASDEDTNWAGEISDTATGLVELDQTAVVVDCPSEVDDAESGLIATDSDTRTVGYGAGTRAKRAETPHCVAESDFSTTDIGKPINVAVRAVFQTLSDTAEIRVPDRVNPVAGRTRRSRFSIVLGGDVWPDRGEGQIRKLGETGSIEMVVRQDGLALHCHRGRENSPLDGEMQRHDPGNEHDDHPAQ